MGQESGLERIAKVNRAGSFQIRTAATQGKEEGRPNALLEKLLADGRVLLLRNAIHP